MRDESNDCVRRLIARSFFITKGIGAFRQQDGHVRGSRIRQGVCNFSSARWTGPENGYCLPVLLVRLVSQRFRLTPDRAYLEIGGTVMFMEVESAQECVTTHLPNGLAPKVDIAYRYCWYGSCLNV